MKSLDRRLHVLMAIAVVMAMLTQLVIGATAEEAAPTEGVDQGEVLDRDTVGSGNLLMEPMSRGNRCDDTSLSLTVSPGTTKAGNNVTMSARLRKGNNGVNNKTITFTVQNANNDIVGTLSDSTSRSGGSSGWASVQWTSLTPGTYTVTASFGGDKDYCASGDTKSFTLTPPPTGSVRIVKKAPDDPHLVFSFTGPNGDFTLNHTDDTGHITENLVTGQYHEFTEVDIPAGWTLDSVSCSNTDGSVQQIKIGGKLVGLKVKVKENKQATCTFTNKRAAGVYLIKETKNAPQGDATGFSFTWSGGPSGSATLSAGEQIYLGTMSKNKTLTITEGALPSAWSVDSIKCDGAANKSVEKNEGQRKVSIKDNNNNNTGKVITCTFTNEYTPPPTATIKVIKVVDGGPKASNPSAFTLEVTKPDSTTQTVTGQGAPGAAVTITGTFGEYSVTELNVPEGYTPSYSGCSGTIAAGQTVTCTVTNTYTPPEGTLKIVKQVMGDPGSEQVFTFKSGNGTIGSTQGEDEFSVTIPADTDYEFYEDVPAGWYLTSISGSGCQEDPQSRRVTVNVAKDATVTCTFMNAKAATITVNKQVDGQNVPNPLPAFTLVHPGLGEGSSAFAPDNPVVFTNVEPGKPYTFSEGALPSGWSLSDLACDAQNLEEGPGTITVTPAAGEQITCDFTNTYTPAKLKVRKVVNGGPATSDDFNITVMLNGNTVFSEPGTLDFTEVILGAGGNYSVTEAAGDGIDGSHYYATATGACEGTIQAGETKECTITNTYAPPGTLTIVKQVANGGPWPGDGFTFSSDHPDYATFVLTEKNPSIQWDLKHGESFTIGEVNTPDGWFIADVECTTDNYGVGETGLWVGYDDGKAIVCTFTNEAEPGSIWVWKYVESDRESDQEREFTFRLNGVPDTRTIPVDDGWGTWLDLPAGTYTLTEDAIGERGWSVTDILCASGGEGEGAPGFNPNLAQRSATFVVEPGAKVVCWFTNTYSPPSDPGNPPPPPTSDDDEETPIDPEQPGAGPQDPGDPGTGDNTGEEIPAPPPASGPDLPFTGGDYLWHLVAGAALTATSAGQLVVRRRRAKQPNAKA